MTAERKCVCVQQITATEIVLTMLVVVQRHKVASMLSVSVTIEILYHYIAVHYDFVEFYAHH